MNAIIHEHGTAKFKAQLESLHTHKTPEEPAWPTIQTIIARMPATHAQAGDNGPAPRSPATPRPRQSPGDTGSEHDQHLSPIERYRASRNERSVYPCALVKCVLLLFRRPWWGDMSRGWYSGYLFPLKGNDTSRMPLGVAPVAKILLYIFPGATLSDYASFRQGSILLSECVRSVLSIRYRFLHSLCRKVDPILAANPRRRVARGIYTLAKLDEPLSARRLNYEPVFPSAASF